jgi:transposase-like protein
MNSIIQNILNGQVDIDHLIQELIKNFLEKILQAELTEHLGYSKYNSKGKNSGNSRNGTYERNLKTKYGEIKDLKVPRDRNGDFNTVLFEPHKRQDNWLEEMIINMYARGLSTRDIANIIEKMYGSNYSATSISNITDVAVEELNKWHKRPLKNRYSIIFIDAMSIKVRRDFVDNESVYLIIGIDEEGYREILDFYIGVSESSSLWEEVLLNIKKRGVQQVLLGVMDGLPGLKDTFLKVFPKSDIQRCVVHKVRNTIAKVRKKDLHEIIQDMKNIYESTTLEYAEKELESFTGKWSSKYPKVTKSWHEDKNELFTFFKYPSSIRRSIYTTNWIERTNKEIRKRTKTTNSLPNIKAAEKLVYLQIINYNEKWSDRRMKGYLMAKEQIQQFFKERYQ